jgi:hypothetical protein
VDTQVTPDFISAAEQQALIDWANSADLVVRNQPDHLLDSEQNKDVKPTSGLRKSTFIYEDGGPQEFYDIQARITEKYGLQDAMPEGRQGKVITHEVDSETPTHVDFYRHMGPGYIRGILLVQKPEAGGLSWIDGEWFELPERGLVMFDASLPHAVSLITEGKRIIFGYGWKSERVN